jgi:hypothetical protein
MSKRETTWTIARQVAGIGCAALALLAASSDRSAASSHREAPSISKDQYADNTDTYVFIPPGKTDRIVLAALWIPFEGPEGGPNYYEWDDNVRYEINVDVDGEATADVTYTLASKTTVQHPDTFLYNTGPILAVPSDKWNRQQTHTITESRKPCGGGSPVVTTVLEDAYAPPVNIGAKSTPKYAQLAADTTYRASLGGDKLRIFAGQRDDSFFVDLQVFDLLTLRGQAPPVGYAVGNNSPVDSVSGFNAHAIVIELPISRLKCNNEPVLGVWAASERATTPGGQTFAQVSRLGMPLVNEVVLPMGLKDTFNTLTPSQDLGAYNLLQKSVEDPELGNLLCGLYAVPLPGDTGSNCSTDFTAGTPRTGRGDIFDIFLQGMVLASPFTIQTANGPVQLPAGFNVNRPAGVVPAEMIRINTSISGDLCSPTPSALGVLGGDACGFPNGRRLTDDVVDIELLAVAGAAYQVLDGRDASFVFTSSLASVLTDGVSQNDVPLLKAFPYIARPQSGQEHLHQNPS